MPCYPCARTHALRYSYAEEEQTKLPRGERGSVNTVGQHLGSVSTAGAALLYRMCGNVVATAQLCLSCSMMRPSAPPPLLTRPTIMQCTMHRDLGQLCCSTAFFKSSAWGGDNTLQNNRYLTEHCETCEICQS